jgi:type V secretory pathway adhesin AidA
LGDSGTGTGDLFIHRSATMFAAGAYAVEPFTDRQLVNVVNAGTIDLTGNGPTDTLTIVGNYIGATGTLVLETELGDSKSPSDIMIVDGGDVFGFSFLDVTNAGGLGDLTTGHGIRVVELFAAEPAEPG